MITPDYHMSNHVHSKMNTRSNGGYYGYYDHYNHYKPIEILISDWSVNYAACIAYPVSGYRAHTATTYSLLTHCNTR